MKKSTKLLVAFMAITMISEFKPSFSDIGKSYFIHVNPNNINYKEIKDTVNKMSKEILFIIKKYNYENEIITISIEYFYCKTNSKEEISSLKKLCKRLMKPVKINFKELPNKNFEIKPLGEYF